MSIANVNNIMRRLKHTHTHTHTYTHADTHTHIHTYTQIQTRIHIHRCGFKKSTENYERFSDNSN